MTPGAGLTSRSSATMSMPLINGGGFWASSRLPTNNESVMKCIRPYYTDHVAPVNAKRLARIIHDDSSRNRAVASRDGRAEARGREAYSLQYGDRLSGEPACLPARERAGRLVAAADPRLQQKRS